MMQHRAMDGVAMVITDRAIERRERAIGSFHARADRFARIGQAGESDPWFALRVMTGCEKAVEKALTDRAVEALVPMRKGCLLYTSPSPRDKRQYRMPSSA